MAERYEPVDHSTLSKAGHAAGHAASGGFFGTVLGMLASPFVAVGAVLGLGTLSYYLFAAAATAATSGVAGSFALTAFAGVGALMAGAGAIAATIGIVPVMAATIIGGGLFGAMRGASKGSSLVDKEQSAHAYQHAYDMQMAKMNATMAAQVEAVEQQRMAYQQMALEHLRGAYADPKAQELAGAKPVAAPEERQVAPEMEVPASLIAASTAQHQNRVAAPELSMAKA